MRHVIIATTLAVLGILASNVQGAAADTTPAAAVAYHVICVDNSVAGHPLPEVCVPVPT